jgi:hypothetical protein
LTECFSTIARGSIEGLASYLKLTEEKKEALASAGETATRIGSIAAFENINSAKNIAIFSGLITFAKMIEFGAKTLKMESPQESVQKLATKISNNVIGEDATRRFGDLSRNIPDPLKSFMCQALFVFSLYAIDNTIKNSQNEDDKIQTLDITSKLVVGFVASLCSGLINGAINIAVNKYFPRTQTNRVEEVITEVNPRIEPPRVEQVITEVNPRIETPGVEEVSTRVVSEGMSPLQAQLCMRQGGRRFNPLANPEDHSSIV